MAEILAVSNSASNGVKVQIDTILMNEKDLKEANAEEETGVTGESEIEVIGGTEMMVVEEKIQAEIVAREEEGLAREIDPKIDLYLPILASTHKTLKIKTRKMLILVEDLLFQETKAEVQEGRTHEIEMSIGKDGVIQEIIRLLLVVPIEEIEIGGMTLGGVVIMSIIEVTEGTETDGEEEIIEETAQEIGMKNEDGIRGEKKETEMKMIMDQKEVRKGVTKKSKGKNRFHRKKIDTPRIIKWEKKKKKLTEEVKVKRNNCMKIRQETKMVSLLRILRVEKVRNN